MKWTVLPHLPSTCVNPDLGAFDCSRAIVTCVRRAMVPVSTVLFGSKSPPTGLSVNEIHGAGPEARKVSLSDFVLDSVKGDSFEGQC